MDRIHGIRLCVKILGVGCCVKDRTTKAYRHADWGQAVMYALDNKVTGCYKGHYKLGGPLKEEEQEEKKNVPVLQASVSQQG